MRRDRYTQRLWLNYAYAFFKDFAFFSAVLVPFFTQWGGISLVQVQLLQSWFSLWVFILEVPTGAVADKIGRKHSIALGSLVVSLAVLLYGSIPRYEVFLVSEFLFAVGYALSSGADQALLYDTLKEEGKEGESVKILGRANSFHLLGMLIAAPIGGIIASRFGINAPILSSSIPFFIAAMVGWSIPEPKIHTGESQTPRYGDIVRKGLSVLRTNPWVRALAIDSVLVAASAYFVIWFYQPLLTRLGVPIFYFGFAHALCLVAQILISSHFPTLEKLMGSGTRYLRVSALITAGSFILVAAYPHVITVILFLLLAGGVGLTRATYIVSLANASIPSRERATVLSSIQMIRRLALVILNPFVGWTADYSLRLALFLVGLLPLGTLVLSSIEKDKTRASIH
ncbi:MFS transporter [Candidatus Gottesmanbacteria bacterium]|nr:MFS transporter [Candidatus Gottesmanbacteria bacterium]